MLQPDAMLRSAEDDAPPAVLAEAVRFRWPGRDGFALSLPAFRVPAGERVLLAGPSGSGKSTLLNLLAGIAVPAEGSIRLAGTDIAALRGAARDRFRAEHLGIVFQMFNLVPYLSCLENVLLPLRFAPGRRNRAASGGTPEAEALRLLGRLGLDAPALASRPAGALSVGQQQRVAAARALIGRPGLVIADEPTSALDRDSQANFLALLSEEVDRAGAALLMVSHDLTLAPAFDRVVALADLTGPAR